MLTRRSFVMAGGLGAAASILPGIARARESGTRTRNTSVVWLWLGGGATHIETFNPVPDAPEEFRSVSGTVRTNIPGVYLGGDFTRSASIADKLSFVRSFSHRNAGHPGGTHWVMTGYDNVAADNGGSPTRPSIGSVMARHRGSNVDGGLPAYVKMQGIFGDGPSFLGATFAPFDFAGDARNNLNRLMAQNRTADRRELRRAFDAFRSEADRSGISGAMDEFERQAFGLVEGVAVNAFDVDKEPLHVKAAYGDSPVGHQLLTARRLVEAGVGFVTVHSGGWDMHSSIKGGMRNLVPSLDCAIAGFVNDIHARGLSDDVMLVITGEFGRTPRINPDGGRDHWPGLSTLAIAGGGMKHGQVIGESSAKAELPKTRPVTPQDLMATVFRHLGLPDDLTYADHTGRPTRMVEYGSPIAELF